MSEALRIQALTLPVGEIEPADKFCRWALEAKPAPDDGDGPVRRVGWGREDRIELVDAGALEEAEEAVTLRLAPHTLEGVAGWLAERGLSPERVATPPEDAGEAAERWPDALRETLEEETWGNRTVVSVRGPTAPRIDLFFPLPKEVLVTRSRVGPFAWRSKERGDLEVPGLLGVTTGAPDPAAWREFLATLGVVPPGEDRGGPLSVGDHQWIVEERDPGGIYGYAIVVPVAKVKDLARTMEHLEVDHRLDGARVLAADPAGRVVLVHGVRAA